MSKGYSYKNEPWLGFEKGNFSIFSDDFVHDKTLVIKAKVENEKGGANVK